MHNLRTLCLSVTSTRYTLSLDDESFLFTRLQHIDFVMVTDDLKPFFQVFATWGLLALDSVQLSSPATPLEWSTFFKEHGRKLKMLDLLSEVIDINEILQLCPWLTSLTIDVTKLVDFSLYHNEVRTISLRNDFLLNNFSECMRRVDNLLTVATMHSNFPQLNLLKFVDVGWDVLQRLP